MVHLTCPECNHRGIVKKDKAEHTAEEYGLFELERFKKDTIYGCPSCGSEFKLVVVN